MGVPVRRASTVLILPFFHFYKQSCPAISVFSAKNLDFALQAAAQNFCSQEVCVDDSKV